MLLFGFTAGHGRFWSGFEIGLQLAGFCGFRCGVMGPRIQDRPSAIAGLGAVLGTGVADDEPALRELLDDGAELAWAEAVVTAGQTFDGAGAIGVGLEAADRPEAG